MIPIRLSISGFLSYRENVEIDFTQFELACISGPNGAGKSSLLDAVTWALFGQARKKDDSIIHLLSERADVCLIFVYEGNIYQVRRIKPRDKTMLLEFQILQEPEDGFPAEDIKSKISSGVWKPLTEHSLRETERRIEQTLRMDYETFINASFFLQGKADQFTQQRPGDRKRILGSILGLEVWETYRERAAERRRGVEKRIFEVDGQLKEIITELDEEGARRARLNELEASLKRQRQLREAQEALTRSARQAADQIKNQQGVVDMLVRQLDSTERQLEQLRARLDERRQEEQQYLACLSQAGQIEAAYRDWQNLRRELEQLEKVASQFREFEKLREQPRLLIQAEKSRLEQELSSLHLAREQAQAGEVEEIRLLEQIEKVSAELNLVQGRLDERKQLEEKLQAVRAIQADLRAENLSLKPEMEKLKERISRLEETDQAECPVCGQPLLPDDRQALIERLQAEGQEMGDRYRNNRKRQQEIDDEAGRLEVQINALLSSENQLLQLTAGRAQLQTQLEQSQARSHEWQENGSRRLADLERKLAAQDYAQEARQQLIELDSQLKAIGYDAAGHDLIRQKEQAGRSSELELRSLEGARAALNPLQREIAALGEQVNNLQVETDRQREDYDRAVEALSAVQSQAPDLDEAESRLLDIQEDENRLREAVGSAQQAVAVLEPQKARRSALEEEREQLTRLVGRYRQLDRAFGKDGVPALLIEQALPQIEIKANEILDRLSGGMMSVQFVTQARYRDRTREDFRETLDIVIRDGAGKRDYELFSGGEAFRVNFAIRLALSEVLAQRAGARLQTLVIDEGFGSQDVDGRQRLIEAINQVRSDFAKILVITHIDELKDAFPNRIEIEKTNTGSIATIV